MKKLILIRHSFAEMGSEAPTDFDRNLTPTGIIIAQNQAELLTRNQLIPEIIISSDANRALQTSAEFLNILKPRLGIKKMRLLYSDYTTAEFFNVLNSIDNKINVVAIVGHNPSVSAMANRLDPASRNGFKPGSMAVFSISEKWSDLQVGNAKIEHYFSS